jgi:hypothetical protein
LCGKTGCALRIALRLTQHQNAIKFLRQAQKTTALSGQALATALGRFCHADAMQIILVCMGNSHELSVVAADIGLLARPKRFELLTPRFVARPGPK